MKLKALAALLLLTAATPALAQSTMPVRNSAPQPAPMPDTIPAARDVPYPGVMTLNIDATDTRHYTFSTHETLTGVTPGEMVLLFPQWLPGTHSPTGQIDKLAGLHFRVNGRELAWRRDPVNVTAFHVTIPDGARQLDIDLQFLSATAADQGGIVMSPDMLRLQWNSMSLYPAGYFTRQIPVRATVRYPDGFTASSGLPATHVGSSYSYQPTNYEVLVDSPTLAGRYYRQWQLSPRVFLDTYADTMAELDAATPAQIEAHRNLVTQAVAVFGAQHYDTYHFLFAISDQIGGQGLEHHRSSEDGVKSGYFTEYARGPGARNLLPHEYTHSWDGKFRRGADLWTPTFAEPMGDSLLWVYEGQTQFWGYVLQARSGLVSRQDTIDQYAMIAASLDTRPARTWRPLIDTTNDPTISQRRPRGWVSWQRSEDYYNEGLLIWMEVDSVLRRESHGTKSIDDFARAFFGLTDGDYGEVTYTFDDVVNGLNAVQPYDWRTFLTQRVYQTNEHAPLAGFANNGYRLVYNTTPSPAYLDAERYRKIADFSYSLGIVVSNENNNALSAVQWDSPAFRAGMTLGEGVVAVNGRAYTADLLRQTVTAAAATHDPIVLTLKRGDRYVTASIDYHGGLRYPHFERTGTGEAGLDRLLAPR